MKMLIIYYSAYGHIRTMAEAAAAAALEIPGVEVTVRRVPETLDNDILAKMGALDAAKAQADVPVATVDDLAEADAILFGTPTRFGNMTGQMRQFLDGTGGLWMKGALVGKPGGVFTSSATQHGGQESTILSFHTYLLHQGMVVVGLPYAFQGQMRMDEITGDRLTGPVPSRPVTARASHRKTNLKACASRPCTWPKSGSSSS